MKERRYVIKLDGATQYIAHGYKAKDGCVRKLLTLTKYRARRDIVVYYYQDTELIRLRQYGREEGSV